ncbi:MAG: hypothetical protein HY694_02355 [Deltaproteobacteria bacterium]|nr:hypothetical protein [Deltaproteobacteria bacterium]
MGNILVDHPNVAEAAVIGKRHAVPLSLLEVRKRGVLEIMYVPCAH